MRVQQLNRNLNFAVIELTVAKSRLNELPGMEEEIIKVQEAIDILEDVISEIKDIP